jgi:hypothetical protein
VTVPNAPVHFVAISRPKPVRDPQHVGTRAKGSNKGRLPRIVRSDQKDIAAQIHREALESLEVGQLYATQHAGSGLPDIPDCGGT